MLLPKKIKKKIIKEEETGLSTIYLNTKIIIINNNNNIKLKYCKWDQHRLIKK